MAQQRLQFWGSNIKMPLGISFLKSELSSEKTWVDTANLKHQPKVILIDMLKFQLSKALFCIVHADDIF